MYLLRVDSAKRANIDKIIRRFEELNEHCATSSEYCTSRQKEATLHGPVLPEIVELPEYQDQNSPSTPPEKGLSNPQTPTSIQEDEAASSTSNEPGRAERVVKAKTSTGLGISAPSTVVIQMPKPESPNGALLTNNDSRPRVDNHKKQRSPSGNNFVHISDVLGPTNHEVPQSRDVQPPPAQMKSETSGEQRVRVNDHPSSSTSNNGHTVAFQATSIPPALAPPSAPAPSESRRQRSRRRIVKLLDLCLGIE